MKFPHTLKRGSVSLKIYRINRPARANRPAARCFTLSWHAGGQRHTKQFASEAAAVEEAQLKLDQLTSGKIDAAAAMTMEDASVLEEARKIADGVPILAALAEWSKARKLAGGDLLQAARAWADKQGTGYKSDIVENVVGAFLAAKIKERVKVRTTYKTLAHLRAQFGGVNMDTVTVVALEKWMHTRYPSAVYHNTALTRFRTLWAWARKKGFLPKHAETVADEIAKIHQESKRIGIIRTATLKTLLAMVREKNPELIAPLVLAALCGLRSVEVHSQQWSDIDLAAGHLTVTGAKLNTPAFRIVPLCDSAKEWLLLCGDRTERVCRTVVDVEKVRDLAAAAKIKLPDNAFRHSYISHAVAATGDVNRTALDSGNSPKKIFANYRALVTKAEGEAWFALTPAAVEEKEGKIVNMKEAARA